MLALLGVNKPHLRHPHKFPNRMSTKLVHPFTAPPSSGETTELREGVLWCRHQLPFALDHINTWIIGDPSQRTLVDSGISDGRTRGGWDTILNTTGIENVERVLITHYHPDHIGNADWLSQKTNAPVWMTYSEFMMAHALVGGLEAQTTGAVGRLFNLHGLPPNLTEAVCAKGGHYPKLVESLPPTFTRLQNNDHVTTGDISWQIMTGSGHSPEHISLYSSERNTLISGDMLLPKITTNVAVWPASPDDNPLKEFLTSIDKFASLPEDTLVLPSHGLPFTGLHERISQLHAHHTDRLEQVLAACNSPKTAYDILPTLFNRELDSYQLFFAMGEAVAHLNYLWHEGALSRDANEKSSGVTQFVSC